MVALNSSENTDMHHSKNIILFWMILKFCFVEDFEEEERRNSSKFIDLLFWKSYVHSTELANNKESYLF